MKAWSILWPKKALFRWLPHMGYGNCSHPRYWVLSTSLGPHDWQALGLFNRFAPDPVSSYNRIWTGLEHVFFPTYLFQSATTSHRLPPFHILLEKCPNYVVTDCCTFFVYYSVTSKVLRKHPLRVCHSLQVWGSPLAFNNVSVKLQSDLNFVHRKQLTMLYSCWMQNWTFFHIMYIY